MRAIEEAKVDLAELVATIEGCVLGALKSFITDHAGFRHIYSKTTEANIIHNYMAMKFRETFVSHRHVTIHAIRNTTVVAVLSGKYQAKLKKLNSRLHTQNIPTQAVLDFVHQDQQIWLENVPAPTNLHIGYQPGDDAALTQSRIWITCPAGTKKVSWAWEITRGEAASSGDAQVLPIRPPSDQGGKKKRAKLKKVDQAEPAASSEGTDDAAPPKG